MAGNEELILIQRYTSRHMRHWWSRSGAVWLALLAVCLVTILFIDPVSTFTAAHFHFSAYWLMASSWFPALAVAVCLVGAQEASQFSAALLKDTTIPNLRLPIKIRAIVCFSQCLWPTTMLVVMLCILAIIRSSPQQTIMMQSILHLPGFSFHITGLDIVELALICLWCIGLLVAKPDQPWMSFVLLACFFVYSSNDLPFIGSGGRPPLDALDVIDSLLECISYAAIVGCIVCFARGWSTIGYRLYTVLITGAALGLPDWMGAITSRGWLNYLPDGSSFLPSGMCVGQEGYLFAWVVPSLDEPLLTTFVNVVWVAVQYLIFFNFVFEDNLIAPSRESRR